MFAYPKKTEFNRVVPKTKIYAHTRVSKRVKELFVTQVGEIVWRYKLSPETINLPARNGIREIQVFDIHLKSPEIDDAVVVAIDKAIPFPLVLQLIHGDVIQTEVSFKRPSEADSSKWVVEARFRSEQRPLGTSCGDLPVALDLAGLYEQIIRRHIPIPARNGESITEQVARFVTLEAKQRERQQLESRLAKEKQFNRKVEMNTALRSLSQELEQITR
ncbi:MAG: DUF4391 domain-containing protein [Verrucomicrobiales bacterium]|nr:MAG: DUF4391 domain-containing protein [Verrucomicrobiales bacterium]